MPGFKPLEDGAVYHVARGKCKEVRDLRDIFSVRVVEQCYICTMSKLFLSAIPVEDVESLHTSIFAPHAPSNI